MNNEELPESLEGVAIIGMAGRFPGAQNVEQFWRNLRDGVESISVLTDEQILSEGVDPELLKHPNYVKAGGTLEGVELFDAAFFGMTPRDAELTDPQQRLFLECASEALESAGYAAEDSQVSIGVYAGTSASTYLTHNLRNHIDHEEGDLSVAMANNKDFLATILSYKLNLRGPSVNIQTGCSTSLVAVHLACQSVLNYQCDIALAGAVQVTLPQNAGYLYQGVGIASPDGHCRAFDAKAQGTVAGNGVGVVVLKRLAEAVEDGDEIYAVIKGSAINNDGALKVGFAAPSVQGQAEVIAMAQAVAGVEPDSISYIEAHGTATPLGDPIEVAALTRAFRASSSRSQFCALGSVKTNIGHLDAAAGIAGLIKTILALKHRQLPPSLHFHEPNPQIDFASTPFYVNRRLVEWESEGGPRRAGVSSFGIGGTNAHVVLEEYAEREEGSLGRRQQLLVMSGRSEGALEEVIRRLGERLKDEEELGSGRLADVAYTLAVGRRVMEHRAAVVCDEMEDAARVLSTRDPRRLMFSVRPTTERPVAFVFSGLGDHYMDMGLGLYRQEKVFRKHLDRCAELLGPHLDRDLRELLFADKWRTSEETQSPRAKDGPAFDLRKMLGRTQPADDEAAKLLNRTCSAHPALFATEYALAQLWMSWGVRPQAMIGYSIGEYVAACVAGVFSLEDALLLVARRAQMIESLSPGAMSAVPLPEAEVAELLGERLSIAAINNPSLCVVAGPLDAIEEMEARLAERDVPSRRLQARHAFHSKMMEPIYDSFVELVGTVPRHEPRIPYISNVTGKWISAREATDPDYWARHLCGTVRFGSGAEELWKTEGRVLLEIGPGNTLTSLATQLAPANDGSERTAIASMRQSYDEQPDGAVLMTALGKLWLAGVPVDWPKLYADERRRRIPLPTYPFERQRYWIEPPSARKNSPAPQTYDGSQRYATLEKKSDIADWFYVPSWKRSLPFTAREKSARPETREQWLVFMDEDGVADALVRKLRESGREVSAVRAAAAARRVEEGDYRLDPADDAAYDRLIADLQRSDRMPDRVVHLWSLLSPGAGTTRDELLEQAQRVGTYSLLGLVQALCRAHVTKALRFDVVTDGVQDVTGEEELKPERATILGPCKVIPQEFTNITCRSIDIAGRSADGGAAENLIEQLWLELTSNRAGTCVAYRAGHRWEQTFEPLPLYAEQGRPCGLRRNGVYLITGGLGKVGLVLARHLARKAEARLILTGRTSLPAREEWDTWLQIHDREDRTSRRLRALLELEETGAKVLTVAADAANRQQMQAVIRQCTELFGGLNGVIHAAGIVEGRSIQELSRADCERSLSPKARGLYVLEDVLADQELDFCALFSSSSAILGGLDHAAYAASNIFMDVYAQRHNRTAKLPWVSINWDTWTDGSESAGTRPSRITLSNLLMTPDESTDAFERILSSGVAPQVIVAVGDIHARISQWISPAPEMPAEARTYRQTRPSLRNEYVAPTSELERKLVAIWEEVLGIEQIGIYDNFFELGGHSLLGTRVLSRVRKAFSVDLPVRVIFNTPTIADFAETIVRKQAEKVDGETLTEILTALKQMPEEEARMLLAADAAAAADGADSFRTEAAPGNYTA
jgi:acyl transferase domain-containing protein